jgi:hypothetical protein
MNPTARHVMRDECEVPFIVGSRIKGKPDIRPKPLSQRLTDRLIGHRTPSGPRS